MSTSYISYRPPLPAPRKSKKKIKILFFAVLFIGICCAVFVCIRNNLPVKIQSQLDTMSVASAKAATPNAQSTSAVLESAWKSVIGSRQGNIDIALYDHKTGEISHVTNAAGTYNTASVVKLAILEEVLLQDQNNGTSISNDQLSEAEPMIENSDNDAASALWNEVGGQSAMDDFFNQLNMSSTQANVDDHWGLTQSTALDQLAVLNTFAYPGKILTSDSANVVRDLLSNVETDQAWGVSAGVPAGVSVDLKNGWLADSATNDSEDTQSDSWTVNSIGHVYGNGVDYTIAVLTDHQPSEQYGIDTIESLSTVTWGTISKK